MNGPDWQKFFWRNTFTNYLRTVLRMGTGVVLFRLTFQHLSPEQFGFYSLLWSLFGYTILLDFGLGFTAQKAVAEGTASGEVAGVNRLICTIFWSFAAVAVALLLLFSLGKGAFLTWTHVAPENRADFGQAFMIFFVAMALAFPMGLFPEMLRGLQRIDLANWVTIAALLGNFGFMTWALLAHWSFQSIVLISVATTVLPNFVALFLVFQRIPGLSLHPRNFHLASVRGVLSFSIVAYLITFTNLIMARTDQAVISFTIGIAFVALYQAGYKAAEMFGIFSVQMQDALSPAAAQLRARGDREGLRELLIKSTQLIVFLTTPLYALCAAYLEPLIGVLTGLKSVDTATYWVGQALLFSTFSSLITNSGAKRILMMCGWERQLLKISLVDAGLNLLVSLVLVHKFGVLGVALGTTVPTVLLGWLWQVPITARFLGMGVWEFVGAVASRVLAPVGAAIAVLLLLYWAVPLAGPSTFAACIWRGALVMLVLMALGLPFLRQIRAKA